VEPLTRGLLPLDPCSLCSLSSTEFVEPPSHPKKIPGITPSPKIIPGYATALENTLYSKSLSLNGIKYFRTTKCNKVQKMVEVKYSFSQVKEESATGM
jgi:uncharacterized protein YdhG (YjbR/CyaY superfamily)